MLQHAWNPVHPTFGPYGYDHLGTHAFAAAAEGYRRFIPFILMEKRTVVFDSSEYCSGFGFKKDTWCLWIVMDSTYVLWNASVAMGKHILYQYIILYHTISSYIPKPKNTLLTVTICDWSPRLLPLLLPPPPHDLPIFGHDPVNPHRLMMFRKGKPLKS